MVDKNQLLDELAADLKPVSRLPLGATVVLWLVVSWAFVVAITLATGDLRPGWFGQLETTPRFLVECALGFTAGLLVFRTGLLLSVPGRVAWKRAVPATLAWIAVWIGAYVYGLYDPAIEPSMMGKRPGCFSETFLFSSVPLALGLFLVARRAPLRRAWVGALVGSASAAIPALMMQIACMYDPRHILQFHLMPVVITGAIGAVLGWLVLRKV